MADDKLKLIATCDDFGLVTCGICKSDISEPKLLPCLHSFCFKCLQKLHKRSQQCPACHEDIPWPSDGVAGLKDNTFLNKLKSRRDICKPQKGSPCTCCGATNGDFPARCSDCNGFLCRNCVDLHKNIAPLKVHAVIAIEDLRSGKVDISKVLKPESCPHHTDQPLEFFCKTCSEAICHSCTVVDHSRPDHDCATLEAATDVQKVEMGKLMLNCAKIAKSIETSIKQADKVKTDLKASLDIATELLVASKEQAKKELLENLDDQFRSTSERFRNIDKETCREIDADKANLKNLQAKLINAMKLANHVVRGSQQDVATNFSTVADVLQQLQGTQVKAFDENMGKVEFMKTKEKQQIKPLGKIKLKRGTLEIVTGAKSSSRGVAIGPNGCIAIADSEAAQVRVYSYDGDFKFVLNTNHGLRQEEASFPWDVAINSSGRFYVTDGTPFVKIFGPTGKYIRQFTTRSPDGRISDNDNSALCGIVIDRKGELWVGSSNYYVSRHKQDGTLLSTIKTDIHPWWLAVTPRGRLVVCSASSNLGILGVQVLDRNGQLFYTIDGSYSKHVKSWCPEGVFCRDDADVIYISSWDTGNKGGIYSFKENGEFIGCVTTDVTYAHGIALTGDAKDKMVVAQGNGNPVKIITIK